MAEKHMPQIFSTPITSTFHQVFFDGEFENRSHYRDVISLLSTAPECDEIEILLNTYGGRLDIALAIVEAIKATRAKVRAVVVGACMSAGTLVMLACPEINITDAARVMVHTLSYGSAGKAIDVKAHVEYVHRIETKMMRDAYVGFLTFDELDQLEAGKEFWFDADETIERIQNRDKYLEELHKEHEQTALTPESDQPAPTAE